MEKLGYSLHEVVPPYDILRDVFHSIAEVEAVSVAEYGSTLSLVEFYAVDRVPK